ncbi:hypothetical protein [Streptomyces antibioticus]|uniref:hypothetical protein n=1 Tax=Streptomyces antibioticus TaxID=1890 RepID=UPI0033A01F93
MASPLIPEQRTVYRTVTAHNAHRSTGLRYASAVRHAFDSWCTKPSTPRPEFAGHTCLQTRTVTSFEDLPASDEATPQPDPPASASVPRAVDTTALAAAVLPCAREHGDGAVLRDAQLPRSGEPD